MNRAQLDTMLACPVCDLLQVREPEDDDVPQHCERCHHVLLSNRSNVIDMTLAAAVSTAILMTAAVFFPFISLQQMGLRRDASVLDAVGAFAEGWSAPLVIGVAAFIVVIPVLRAMALCYSLLPLRFGWSLPQGAQGSFRLAMALKPWSMAEIFIVGVAVALVKVVDLADVSLGPAFWAFAAMVAIVMLENTTLCKWTIWRQLAERAREE